MKRSRLLLTAAAVVVLVGGFCSALPAQYHGYQYGYPLYLSPGFGSGGMLYSLGYVPVPPYYALHPPVYYSYPVGRTYGYSPYAYPDYVKTPDAARPAPKTIINPHVKPKAPAESESTKTIGRTASAAHTVFNPFVEPSPARDEMARFGPKAGRERP